MPLSHNGRRIQQPPATFYWRAYGTTAVWTDVGWLSNNNNVDPSCFYIYLATIGLTLIDDYDDDDW